ncbi:MAG TPA: Uma2 family endonuclease [Blastocatellia bacterium]|nr:Uma2 family endonuclease [Blastocatellia bacterium]
MPIATATDYLAAIAHIPPGTTLRADNVAWEDYEQLTYDLRESSAVRVFYDQGKMEIMSPLPAHEKPVKVLHRLVTALSDELNIDIESLGSSTLKKELKDKGAEPDDCFYVQNAALVIGKEDLDLQHNPPPDIVIESDLTSSSLDRFAIYAGLGVPEIWRVFNRHVDIWLLAEADYEESSHSAAFPFLTVAALNEFLLLGLTEGERKAAQALRDWINLHA